jgi:hypothetical protein
MALPSHIQEIFFETMLGDKPVTEFEQWVYSEESLERILSLEDYHELISYGYKGEPVIRYGLYRMLEKMIDLAAFEKYRLLRMMRRALLRDERFPYILREIYDLYCRGYSFLDNIGLVYGLSIEAPQYADSWEELTEDEKQKMLANIGPGLDDEVKKVIYWLESGLVVPTGKRDVYDHYEYIDNRSEEEKEPTAYKVIRL